MAAFIVSDHEPTSLRIREVLLFSGRECPISHIIPVDEAAQRLSKEQPDLIVVAFSADPDRGLRLLGLLRGVVPCRVLVVGPTADAKLVLRILRAGADDCIDSAELEPELEAALTRIEKEGSEQGEPGRLIVVLAPNGGSGSSTLATNMAAALARDHRDVGLFDLKLESGDLAALLDVRPTFTLSDLCQNSARLDRVMLERSLVKHASGIHLLAPPKHLSDVSQVSAEGVRQALTLARAIFPYVVVDLDHTFREEQSAVLRMADVVTIVFRLDFNSLRNARRTLEYLGQIDVPRDRVQLVVNRHGQAKEVPTSLAEEALGTKINHFIPEDAWTINRANNNGVPAVLETPKAKVSRSMIQLAQNLNGRHKVN